MGAKITVGGVEITVSVSELGEALKQLSPWLPARTSEDQGKRKAVSWPLPGGSAAMPTPSAQPHLQRDLLPETAVGTALRTAPTSSLGAASHVDAAKRAIALFKALRDHRASGGMMPEEVMPLVGTTHPKGIGNRMQAINALLREKGFAADDVYSNSRSETGKRVWLARARIEEAIKALDDDHL